VVGVASSPDYPVTAGAFQPTLRGSQNAFASKLNATGTSLLYSTYLGGSSSDGAAGVVLDGSGAVFITGSASSADFPTTAGAFQTTLPGATAAFVSKLNSSASALDYSTYLGGGAYDWGNGIALDSAGDAFITGETNSSNYPVTAGAFQTVEGGAYVENAFVSKLNSSGSALVYSTYIGGSTGDYGSAIAVDSAGAAYITGQAQSPNYPVTAGAFQRTLAGTTNAFASKLNPAGSALAYSTFLGGSGSDFGAAIAVDGSGEAVLTGGTTSANFPTVSALQASYGGNEDAFVTKVSPSGGSLAWSTYLGGSDVDQGAGIAVDGAGNCYVAGATRSSNFPTTPGSLQSSGSGGSDAFLVRINDGTGLPTSTPTFFSCFANAMAVEITSGAVDFPRTISSRRMMFAGLKKCRPMTNSGREVTEANSSMLRVEVLVAIMHPGRTRESSSARTCFFRAMFS